MYQVSPLGLLWICCHAVAFVPSIVPSHGHHQFTHQQGQEGQHELARRHRIFGTKIRLGLQPIDPELEGIPIPFIDRESNTFIDCFADTTCQLDGVTYTIGVPCDTAVALCKMENEELVPVEESELDDVFSIAAAAIEEEFEEELELQRTPQTLTLVGELEDEDDESDEMDGIETYDSDDETLNEDEESVEALLSFEHRDVEYMLVRLLDPVLLVGVLDEADSVETQKRYLLSVDESQRVMPKLEGIFLDYTQAQAHEDDDIEDFTEVFE